MIPFWIAVSTRFAPCGTGNRGVAVLGVVSTGKYFAPGLVVRLRDAFPEIDVILKVGNRDKIIGDLKQGAIELAVMGRPPRSPANISYEIGPHPHVIIARPDHRLAQIDNISPADLLSETFISREIGSGTRILMMRYLDRVGEGMTYRQVEMGSNETIKQAVIAGLGIAMISQHTVTDELNAGRLVALNVPGLPIVRHWYLLHRTDLRMTPTLQTVRDFILGLKANFCRAGTITVLRRLIPLRDDAALFGVHPTDIRGRHRHAACRLQINPPRLRGDFLRRLKQHILGRMADPVPARLARVAHGTLPSTISVTSSNPPHRIDLLGRAKGAGFGVLRLP